MRKVLFITYYFPPSAGPGVFRSHGFVRHLRTFGWEPTVLTVTPETYKNPGEYGHDPSLIDELPKNLNVVQTASWAPVMLTKALFATHTFRFVFTLLTPFFYERQAMWLFPCLMKALKVVKSEKFDVIYTSALPFSCHLVGSILTTLTGIPWVGDLRDPFTDCGAITFPSPIHYRLFRKLEGWAHRKTARLIANCPAARDQYLESFFSAADAERVCTIQNGYDARIFHGSGVGAATRKAGTMKFIYTGTIADIGPDDIEAKSKASLRFRLRGIFNFKGGKIDHTTRSLYFFLHALRRMVDLHPETKGVVELHVFGKLGPKTNGLIEKLELGEMVKTQAQVPHSRMGEVLADADYLLLPMETPLSRLRAPYVPGKLYEYLASGRPIFLLTPPESDTQDILRRVGGYVAAPATDIARIAQQLEATFLDWEKGVFPKRDMERVKDFDRERLTGRLAEVFEKTLG